ncbi:MAG: hypothetical protein M3169_06025 [Candidatus Eremiobacteraeota bacterium]|nr:hypothetical protein [Candidatus Eremiobacteraeota bacterium]
MTPIKDSLVGFWLFDAAGMQSQVSLAPDGTYTNTLVTGAQGHSGSWAVSDNGSGGHTIVFTLKSWFPTEYVGPLGSTTIIMPKTETWYVTGIQPDQILIHGGVLRRITPGMSALGMPMGGGMQSGAAFSGMMTTDAYNAELAKEMRQIGDAGRKVFGVFKGIFKKR